MNANQPRKIDDLPLLKKGMYLVLVPLIAVLLVTAVGIYFTYEHRNSRAQALHSMDVRRDVAAARSDVQSLWAAHLEANLTPEVTDEEKVRPEATKANASLQALKPLLAKSENQSRQLNEAIQLFERWNGEYLFSPDGKPRGEDPRFDARTISDSRALLDQILHTLDAIFISEQIQLRTLLDDQARFRWLSLIALGFAVLIGIWATLGSGLFVTRGLARRLSDLGDLAATWAKGELPATDPEVPKDEIGNLHHHLLTAARLTQKRAMELDESRRDLQAVMDNMPSVLFIKSPDGEYQFVNRQYENLLGTTLEELREKKHPPNVSAENLEELYEWDRKVIAENRPIQSEDRLTLPDRELYFLSTRFPLPNADGTPRLMCGISTDITERKNALRELEKYRAELEERVVERTIELRRESEAHLESNRKLRNHVLRMQLLNQLTKQIAGRQDLRSLFQTVLQHLQDELSIACGFFFHFDRDSDTLVVGASLDGGRGVIEKLELLPGSTTTIGKNGLRRALNGETINVVKSAPTGEGVLAELGAEGFQSILLAPLRASDASHGVLVVARQEPGGFESSEAEFLTQLGEHIAIAVSQLKLLAELQSRNRDLKDAQEHMAQQERLRAMGQMASGIAHDINNALGPVTVYADILLEDGKLDEESLGYVQTILTAAEGIAATVSRLRHFYRPAEELATLSNLNINSIIKDVVSLTRPRWRDIPQASGHTIRLDLMLAPNLPTISGWDGDIRSAITNLIFNSVDAMSEGGNIVITTELRADYVVIEVADNGAGMEEKTRLQCLEPFFTTKGEKGTGLGLPMVHGIVARHEGRIEIESEPKKGTTIRLFLPTRPKDIDQSILESAGVRRYSGLRILCVDDDPTIRESLQTLLARDGHFITCVESGAAALSQCLLKEEAGEFFDIVITDLGMPKIDGYQLRAKLHERYPILPVILLTGWGSQLIQDRETVTGFVDILAKPPRIVELRAAISKAMSAG